MQKSTLPHGTLTILRRLLLWSILQRWKLRHKRLRSTAHSYKYLWLWTVLSTLHHITTNYVICQGYLQERARGCQNLNGKPMRLGPCLCWLHHCHPVPGSQLLPSTPKKSSLDKFMISLSIQNFITFLVVPLLLSGLKSSKNGEEWNQAGPCDPFLGTEVLPCVSRREFILLAWEFQGLALRRWK